MSDYLASSSSSAVDFIITDSPQWLTLDADNILSGTPGEDDVDVSMTFISTKVITAYSLRYTTGTGFTGDLDWDAQAAELTENSDGSYSISATLPDETTGWYFSVSDGNVYARA